MLRQFILWFLYSKDLIEILLHRKEYKFACDFLISFMNANSSGNKIKSLKSKSLYDYWCILSEIIEFSGKSEKEVEMVLRSGISKFSSEVGKFWNSMAMFYIKSGKFEKARDVFSEALSKVLTLRDFSQVFEAYVEFEESLIERLMENGTADDAEVDLRMLRLEKLLERRSLMVNEVMLRQNPHNVNEWLNRIELFLKVDSVSHEEIVQVFSDAVEAINPKKAHGRLQQIWIEYARYFEELAVAAAGDGDELDLSASRDIFESALKIAYKHPDNLAECYIAYAEMELRHKNVLEAFKIIKRGTLVPSGLKTNPLSVKYLDAETPAYLRVFKSLKLWNFLVDLEESLGNLLVLLMTE
jgi:pre-mRNA-splicing factor SYF1